MGDAAATDPIEDVDDEMGDPAVAPEAVTGGESADGGLVADDVICEAENIGSDAPLAQPTVVERTAPVGGQQEQRFVDDKFLQTVVRQPQWLKEMQVSTSICLQDI